MEQPVTSETPSRICYFDAGRVDSPFDELRGFCVLDAAGRNLGNVAGIVADLSARRVCYWVLAPAAAWEAVDITKLANLQRHRERASFAVRGCAEIEPDFTCLQIDPPPLRGTISLSIRPNHRHEPERGGGGRISFRSSYQVESRRRLG